MFENDERLRQRRTEFHRITDEKRSNVIRVMALRKDYSTFYGNSRYKLFAIFLSNRCMRKDQM